MKLKSKIEKVLEKKSRKVDICGNIVRTITHVDFSSIAEQILWDLELTDDKQPRLKQASVSRRFSVGQKLLVKHHTYLKIMAYADGYYMVRYKSCIPFCCTEKELISRI